MSQKNAIDRILSEIGPQIQAKGSELLGHPLQLGRLETGTFLAGELQNPPTRVLCYLEVEGFATGTAYLGIGLSDAVRLGGTLVMLPGEELEKRAGGEDFDGEEADAYGEIANIISGVINTVFAREPERTYHFKKTRIEALGGSGGGAPARETGSDLLYRAAWPMTLAGKRLGALELLLPGPLFGLELTPPAAQAENEARSAGRQAPATPLAGTPRIPLVLICAESAEEARPFSEALGKERWNCQIFDFQGDLRREVGESALGGIVLVLRETNDRGLSRAIKILSAVREKVPLLAAGSQWTRRSVLQALRFGASDILVTPASAGEIEAKVGELLKEKKGG